MALLAANKVLVEEKKVKDQLIQKGFGERDNSRLVLDLREALFLLEKDKIEIEDSNGEKVSFEELLKQAEKREKNFYNKFIVFRDVRDRGYVIKTGFKFGFDFRVYPRGKKPGEEHTQWVIHVALHDERLSMPELSRIVRLSGNLKTKALIAVVDAENDINYYSLERITP
ncbi:MAG: tRNA-intron lyase [Candidatus Diapherotrites archaeon]|uniref:tRNA-intron lyase n=1 Tax=Candidatus Iainarchaeum sp. TaxID=3101447 RepID=A0A7J4IUN8_9ARCH|nr:MAG: tRNA-intron endonuclease, archaea type [archaeon GW2011_AR10]MBS3059381.1 tRNA-intron lyase [Candidatus Diapherotrites archaeon]HIH08504.1 tRNA-intron lyase [Candidatus Diapherotrites archaeon]